MEMSSEDRDRMQENAADDYNAMVGELVHEANGLYNKLYWYLVGSQVKLGNPMEKAKEFAHGEVLRQFNLKQFIATSPTEVATTLF